MTLTNVYAYHATNLWIAYGLAILFAILVNILGAYAYMVNSVAHDINFSSLVSAATHSSIIRLFKHEKPETRGKLPLPKEIADVEIKFRPLDEGGLGFETAEEIRRKSSVALTPIPSPQLGDLDQIQPFQQRAERVQNDTRNSISLSPHASPHLLDLNQTHSLQQKGSMAHSEARVSFSLSPTASPRIRDLNQMEPATHDKANAVISEEASD